MNWNIVLSIITVGATMIALKQTQQQIRLSNKQHLYDRRIEVYLIVEGLMQLYEGARSNMNGPLKMYDTTVRFIFSGLTNNSYLEDIALVIMNPQQPPLHQEFLRKRERLRKLAVEIKFLFPTDVANSLSAFVSSYEEILYKLYQCKISMKYVDTLLEDRAGRTEKPLTLDQIEKLRFDETDGKGLGEKRDALAIAYKKLVDNETMSKMKRIISLQKD